MDRLGEVRHHRGSGVLKTVRPAGSGPKHGRVIPESENPPNAPILYAH
jgi:hypothetical protein